MKWRQGKTAHLSRSGQIINRGIEQEIDNHYTFKLLQPKINEMVARKNSTFKLLRPNN